MTSESNYNYGKDFVAYLRSPITQEIEYEIKIKADRKVANEYENLLRERKIMFRKTPLDIFPPPVGIVIENPSVADSLAALLIWYSINKSKKVEVTIVDGKGNNYKIQTESDIDKIINLHRKT